jgi:hypothetical protein
MIPTLVIGAVLATMGPEATSPLSKLDLRQIGYLGSKGRVQDNNVPMVAALVEAGAAAVPFLVSKLEDESVVEGRVHDFWADVRVGDVALVILCNFLVGPDLETPTIPGFGWDLLLERRGSTESASELLRGFLAKHGRRELRRRIEGLLRPYSGRLEWSKRDRCFRPTTKR